MAIRLKAFCLAGAALVAVAPAAAQRSGAADAAAPGADDRIDEIVVTAQKREERLLDVPQSISVVFSATLERQQIRSIADYASLVPGLTIQQQTPGQARVVLRGINTGGASPTVAIYVDDTPFGSSTGQSNAAYLAGDIDTFDVERIEVLRGPQGTLYGANSLGGVVKYVTAGPKLDRLEGKAQAGLETVKGGNLGWSANAAVNVPLSGKIAVRASGFYRRTGGFIDTLGLARRDANDVDSYGGRGSILLQPTETLTVRLSALAQNLRSDSRAMYDADPVTLAPQATDPSTGAPVSGLTRTEFYAEKTGVDYRLYNGTLDWDAGFATLTSVTSYGRLFSNDVGDVSYQLPGIGDAVFGTGPNTRGLFFPTQITQKKFTQELRLASPDNDRLEWLVGGYYTHEKGRIFQRYLPFDLATGKAVDQTLVLPVGPGGADVTFPDFLVANLASVYKEYAGFGSATWHVGPRLDLTGGVRYSHNRQSTVQSLDGSFLPLSGAPIGPDTSRGRSSENVFTWSVSPRFELGDHASIYARAAKGYRPGGPNVVPPGAGPDFPRRFEADTLISYELGLRAETPGHGFSVDASVYYLDWRNIQTTVTYQTSLGPVTGDGNGDKARSKGAEITVTARPARGFDLTASIAYSDAKLKDDLPGIDIGAPALISPGLKGDRLPYAPEWTVDLSGDYRWSIGGDAEAFVGGNIRLISDQATDFDLAYRLTYGRRLTIDGYATADLRAGIETGRFNVQFQVRNLTNSRGLINAGRFQTRPGTLVNASPIRPRSFGVTLGASF
jgi:outer membrane receptor protein involved in Fe transport